MDANDLRPLLPKLLIGAGLALQWARANSKFHDLVYQLSAFALVSAAYFLVTPLLAGWRMEVIAYLVWLPDGLAALWGGTFVMSGLAKAAVKAGASPDHPMVPLTNSKGGS